MKEFFTDKGYKKITNYLGTLLDFHHKNKYPIKQRIVGFNIPKKALNIENETDLISRIKGICSIVGIKKITKEYDNGTIISIELGDNNGRT